MPGKQRNASQPERVWGLDDIQELLDLLAKKEITEFEMEQHGVKIRVRRGAPPPGQPGSINGYVLSPVPAPAVVTPPPSSAPTAAIAASSTAAPSGGPTVESTEGVVVMKSPIVGTFYSAPAPNTPPFVKVGDTVEIGQVICIVEAMKLMNELEAEVSGQILRAYVENGRPVEYGQPLFAIEPKGSS